MIRNFIRRLLGKPNDGKLHPESDFILTITDTNISCERPDGTVESIDFSKIDRVEIHRNGLGPYSADLFYFLNGKGSGCVVPVGATNESLLLNRLFELPNFQPGRFWEGLMSTGQFLVWERSLEPQTPEHDH